MGQAGAARAIWEELGRLLRDAGYSEDRLPRRGEDPLLVRRRLPRPGRLTTLVELFALGDAVAGDAARAALAPLDLERLADVDLLVAGGQEVSARLRIDALGELLFLSDPPPPERADHVTGVGAASRTLAALTVRRPVERALDLGTGCGVQAVLAARDAESVVATDVNPRALALAQASAWLNASSGIDFREGSLYEPVGDEPFDLVVSNPPFVISPDRAYVFRDTEQEEIVHAVVAGAAERLREHGFATVLCNWALREGESWLDAIRPWLSKTGCDAWVLHYGNDEPLAYAAKWNAHLRADEPTYAATLDRWLAHHEAAGIAAVANGAVVLRRRGDGGGGWVRGDEAAFGPSASASAQIERVFAAQDALGALSSEADLLERALALVEPHRLDQALAFADGRYAAQPAQLTLSEGAGVRAEVEPEALHVLFRLDGERPLGALVDEAARETGLEEAKVRRASLAAVRLLLELGFAMFVDQASEK